MYGQSELKLTKQEKHYLEFESSDVNIQLGYRSLDRANELVSVTRSNDGTFQLDGLQPATPYVVYTLRDGAAMDSAHYITQSMSSGEIKHWFNHEINPRGPKGIDPDATSYDEIEKQLLSIIKNAKSTIDYCVYNTNVSVVVNALIDASNRGVRVRIITDNSTSNSALNTTLPFPILKDKDSGLMHNKFIVVDVESIDECIVIAGTMNITNAQMRTDPNHLITIQDQSLAKAYTLEFEEMWGSKGTQPDIANSKFSSTKKDNTPHLFTINNKQVELYFSPSDRTSNQIIKQLKSAQNTIDLGLLIFTYEEIQNQLIDNLNNNVQIHGILDETSGSSADVVANLSDAGAKIYEDPLSAIFHYKTCVIDANAPLSAPVLLTGSHNWTFSAETRNDENMLVIKDSQIAELYYRALYYWYNQVVSTKDTKTQNANKVYYENGRLNIALDIEGSQIEDLFITNMDGQIVYQEDKGHQYNQSIIIEKELPKGVYICTIKLNKGLYQCKKFIAL